MAIVTDLTLCVGLLAKDLAMCNVHLCVLLCQKQLQEAVELLDKVKNNEPLTGVTNSQLWEAQKIKQVRNK